MPPSAYVNVRRPDGSVLSVPEDQAGKLEVLGYRRETSGEELSRTSAEATHEYYDTFGQKLTTGLEGAASGATFGLSDPVLQALGDEHIEGRQEENPGWRLGGEILGGVGAAVAAGPEGLLGKVASATPAGAMARALEGTNALARGAIEGGAYGLGGQVSRSSLTDDPFTAEAVLASVGWGALYGMGLAAAGEGASKLAGKVSQHLEEAAPEAAPSKTANELIPAETWDSFRSEVRNVSSVAHEISEGVKDELKKAAPATGSISKELRGEFSALSEIGTDLTGQAATVGNAGALRGIRKAYQKVTDAAKKGDPEAFQGALAGYRATITDWAETLHAKIALPPTATLVRESAIKAGQKAFENAGDLASVAEVLDKVPRTPSKWVSMAHAKAEELHAALEKVMKMELPELAPHQAVLRNALDAVVAKTGVTADSPFAALRTTWKTLRDAQGKRVINSLGDVARGGEGGRKGAGFFGDYLAYRASKEVTKGILKESGIGSIGSYGLYRAIKHTIAHPAAEILAMKGAVTERIRNAVKGLEVVGKGLSKAGGFAADPLRVRLDGTLDDHKPRKELFKARRDEITGAVNSVHNTLFRAVEPLHVFEPAVAKALHASAVGAFKALYDVMPKDPGTGFSMLKSLRAPDPVALERFARAYQVFHDPLSALTSSHTDHAKALANMMPAMVAEHRASLLAHLSDESNHPESYPAQVAHSVILGIPLHSTLRPEFIAAQQAMFSQRATPQQGQRGTPTGQPGPGGGRPPSTQATQAQTSTER